LAFRATALRALSVPNHSGHSGRGTDGDDGGQDIGNGDDHDHGDDEPPDELSKGAAEASSTSAAASMEPVVVVRVLVVQRGDDRRIRNLPELAAALANVTAPGIAGVAPDKRSFRVAVECLSFDALPLVEQLRSLSATHVLVAVDGTALDNAPLAMPKGGGVVALGRDCSDPAARPCLWACACFTLGLQQTPSNLATWQEPAVIAQAQDDDGASKSANANANAGAPKGSAGPIVSDAADAAAAARPALCSAAYSIRLCAELWRPFLETSYLDADVSRAPYTIDVRAAALLVRAHAERLVDRLALSHGPQGSSAEDAARAVAEGRGGAAWGDDVAAAVAAADSDTKGRVRSLALSS
jgi:hypothetical protein